jgi:hypothetical protein
MTDPIKRDVAVPVLLTIGTISFAFLLLASLVPPGADTLWRLHIAQGLLDGKILYRDFIETNPPLWFWAAIPAAALGGYPAVVAVNFVASACAMWLFFRIASLTLAKQSAWFATLGLAFGLFVINVGEIGQREQAFLVASVLWCGLTAARIENKAPPLYLTLIVASFAAYGFALKHYFLLVPIACELFLIGHKKRNWNPFRPETFVLAFWALCYGAAVLLLTPEFLGRILNLVRVSYGNFGPFAGEGPLVSTLMVLRMCAHLLIPCVAWALVRDGRPFVQLLMMCIGLALLIILLQQKGWRYHAIAGAGLSVVALALMWETSVTSGSSGLARRFLPLATLAMIWAAGVQPAISNILSKGQTGLASLSQLVAKEPISSHIAIVSTAPELAFLTTAREGRPHWSRHYSLWMMPGLLKPQKDAELERVRQQELAVTLAELRTDLMCQPPNVIIWEEGEINIPKPTPYASMALLSDDPVFKRWLTSNYAQANQIANYPI